MSDEHAELYAFGQRWGPEAGNKDKIFGFLPGNGVHDIHMNQANAASFQADELPRVAELVRLSGATPG